MVLARFAQADLVRGGAKRKSRKAGRAAADLGGNLVDKIRDNPVPVALLAVGATWLLMSDDSENDADFEAYGESNSRGLKERAGSTAASLGSRTKSAAGSAASGAKSAGLKPAPDASPLSRCGSSRATLIDHTSFVKS